jgi:hypothetical protein
VVGAALLGPCAVAAAAPAPEGEPVAGFEATGPGCPSAATFRAQARERLPARADPSRRFAVRLRPAPGGFEATVEAVEAVEAVEGGAGARVVAARTLSGATCDEVASAALLLVALGTHEAPPPVAPPAPRRDAPARAPAPPERPTRRLSAHVAGLGVALAGAGPTAAGGGLRAGLGVEGPGLFRPEVRAGLDGPFTATARNALGGGRRSLLVARLDLCPFALGPGRASARLCAAGALGEVRVRGLSVPEPKDEGRLFAALGAAVRGRVALVGGLGAELAVGVLAPLLSHRFYLKPDATLVELDAPLPFAEGGVSWSFP